MTGIDVIADFRRRDLAAGGEGAPLVPAFHHFLTEKMRRPFALLNLGGIANLSLFCENGEIQGFDTGPANTLIDQWIYQHTGVNFDAEGEWAASGAINQPLLEALLEEPYFQRSAPKSTGRETFNLEWLNHKLTYFGELSPEDIQATLTELTAVTIADALKHAKLNNCQLILCGGGARNRYLVERLTTHLPDFTIIASDLLGWSADAMEAAAFAWLAWAFKNKKAGNIPAVTGAFGERRLGALYPA
jgi:anhydro-N-acetylmuramic acid kinase